MRSRWMGWLGVTVAIGCARPGATTLADGDGGAEPTPPTVAAQAAAQKEQPPDDGEDEREADRGLVAREPSLRVLGPDGEAAFDRDAFGFVTGPAPASVHPGLWRQAALNNRHGLYKVADGVYQVRGYDLATMSVLVGETGLVVVDPLTSVETAGRALALARKHLGDKPVVAVIFTHSHVDHFGGATAVADPADVASGKVKVYAPEGFMEEATSENLLAGPAMGRRAVYMYGRDLPRGPRGKVDNGLGKEPARGTVSILRPTDLIARTPDARRIDGVDFVFQHTPGSEAPAELTFYLPKTRAFCGAEVLSRTLHNLYTLRGAKVRDAVRWAGYIDEARDRFPDAEVMFFSHHWPVWGKERIFAMMTEQRDTFRYIHDQTLRLANQGYGPREIAERLTLPRALRAHHWNRGYYGTVKHDSKGVYQAYFGWYDGNPATLDPLPRAEGARRYVAYMGGADAVVARARGSYDEGDYRWVAEVLSHVVAAEPGHAAARDLLARTYDQLGYQAESSAWRNAYLTGARELRTDAPKRGADPAAAARMIEQASGERLVQVFQVALDGPRADGVELTVNLTFEDLGETYALELRNAVLHARRGAPDPRASATLTISRRALARIFGQPKALAEALSSPEIKVEGSRLQLVRFLGLLDRPDLAFPIVTPKP